MKLTDTRLNKLLSKIDYYNRNKLSDYEYVKELNYIDPNGYLEKLDNNIDHVIFGRRGSGKTTLLQKSIDRKQESNLCILCDCELYKDDKVLAILIMLLQRVLKGMLDSIDESYYLKLKKEYEFKHKGFTGKVLKVLKKENNKLKQSYENLNYIYSVLKFFDIFLSKIHKMEDNMEIEENYSYEQSNVKNSKAKKDLNVHLNSEAQLKIKPEFFESIVDINAAIKFDGGISYEQSEEKSEKNKSSRSYSTTRKLTKESLLMSLKEPLVDLFNRYSKFYSKKIVLFLDDYYYINKNAQPFIIKFIHQLNKICLNNSFSFKLCSLPNRFKLNKDGEYDLSIEDDFSPIDIDKDLSDLDEIKDFLLDIICAISEEEITPEEFKKLFSPQKEIYYFISACGGNPRDFMNYLDIVIREGRKNNRKNIGRRLIYYASHKSQTRKENSIEDDSIVDKDIVLNAVSMLKSKFIEEKKTNVFLYPFNLNEKHEKLMKSLINLGYIHILRDEIVSDYHGKKTYVPYLIDMSLYVTKTSMKRDLEFREFWIRDNSSRLTKITSAPTWQFPEELILSTL